jgi:hypothetical protein
LESEANLVAAVRVWARLKKKKKKKKKTPIQPSPASEGYSKKGS